MIPGDRARPGRDGPGCGQQGVNPRTAPDILVWNELVHRVPNHGCQRYVPPACLQAEASHLVVRQGDLRPDHTRMITVELDLM